MIRHAVAEGWLLLRSRGLISLVLALALAIPISLAGVTLSVRGWLAPVIELGERDSVVTVLLHPRLDEAGRRGWIDRQARAHPEWRLESVAPAELAARLAEWFPYLEEVLDREGPEMLPPMVEIRTRDPEGVIALRDDIAVLAVGPTASVNRMVGTVARRLALVLISVAAALLAGAVLLAAVWVHLELHRHGEEIAIMRLMGATEATVRGPFLVAVAVPAVLAASISVLLTLAAVAPMVRVAAPLGLAATPTPVTILALQAIAAVGLPIVAALITLERHALANE